MFFYLFYSTLAYQLVAIHGICLKLFKEPFFDSHSRAKGVVVFITYLVNQTLVKFCYFPFLIVDNISEFLFFDHF